MVGWIGSVAEADALTLADVEEISEHWRNERGASGQPVDEDLVEEIDTASREVTEEQWQRICRAEEQYVEKNFRRNPLA